MPSLQPSSYFPAAGQVFAGWHADAALTVSFNPATAITGDITLYAKWDLIDIPVKWFTDGGSQNPGGINMGTLEVEATLGIIGPSDWVHEPQTRAALERAGSVQNLGNVATLVKLTLTATDEDGDVIDNPAIVLGLLEDGVVDAMFDGIAGEFRNANALGTWVDQRSDDWKDWGYYEWWLGADGNVYVAIFGGNDILHFGYEFGVIGGVAGVNYKDLMGIEINANIDWLATQIVDDAIIATFDGIVDVDWDVYPWYVDADGEQFFTLFPAYVEIEDDDDEINPGISPFSFSFGPSYEEKVETFAAGIADEYFRQRVIDVLS